jgi:ribosomal protein S19
VWNTKKRQVVVLSKVNNMYRNAWMKKDIRSYSRRMFILCNMSKDLEGISKCCM